MTASEAGGRFVERLLWVVETCRQRGRSVASYLTMCFQAKRGGGTDLLAVGLIEARAV